MLERGARHTERHTEENTLERGARHTERHTEENTLERERHTERRHTEENTLDRGARHTERMAHPSRLAGLTLCPALILQDVITARSVLTSMEATEDMTEATDHMTHITRQSNIQVGKHSSFADAHLHAQFQL